MAVVVMRASCSGDVNAIEREVDDSFTAYKVLNEIHAGV
jgi:hypothetical protein